MNFSCAVQKIQKIYNTRISSHQSIEDEWSNVFMVRCILSTCCVGRFDFIFGMHLRRRWNDWYWYRNRHSFVVQTFQIIHLTANICTIVTANANAQTVDAARTNSAATAAADARARTGTRRRTWTRSHHTHCLWRSRRRRCHVMMRVRMRMGHIVIARIAQCRSTC